MYRLNKDVCHNGKWFKQGEECSEAVGKELLRMGHVDYVNKEALAGNMNAANSQTKVNTENGKDKSKGK